MEAKVRRRSLACLALAGMGAASLFAGCSDEVAQPDELLAEAQVAPPPISGGTLLVSSDGKTAIAADPDRDRIWIVDLAERALRHEVKVSAGDEPGRVIEDGKGHAFVALRSGHAIVKIDESTGNILARREVCPAPRGMAYDAEKDAVHVACAGGELVTISAVDGKRLRSLRLDRDLRDVVVDGDRLLVSRFRAGDLLVVDAAGQVSERVGLPPTGVDGTVPETFEAGVAWRMISAPGGGVVLAHQRATTRQIKLEQPSAYGGGDNGPCGQPGTGNSPIVYSDITTVSRDADGALTMDATRSGSLPRAALPVDVAVSADGNSFAAVSAGSKRVYISSPSLLGHGPPRDCLLHGPEEQTVPGHPTAVGFVNATDVVVQLREPAGLYFLPDGAILQFPATTARHVGHNIFHLAPKANGSVACASCHPEGRDDARVWNIPPAGLRRTQSLVGGILSTTPLHWDGDMASMGGLMVEVFGRRMGGSPPGPIPLARLESWIDALPPLPHATAPDPEAVARGEVIFHDEAVGCASCHNGAQYTNSQNTFVGTGKPFQTPNLIGIADRAPFMHDGCAPTLRDRFGACGGGDEHGKTSNLSEQQISDLIAFLETL